MRMRKFTFYSMVIVLALVFLAGAVVIIWRGQLLDSTYYTDADSIRVEARDAPVRDVLWQPAVEIDGPFNSRAQEYEPRITADGTTLYFVRGKAGENADIWRAVRTPDGWSEAHPFDVINTDFDELGATPSPDGKSVYFSSNRPGGQGGYDIWITQLGADGWSAPRNLGSASNTPFNDYGPAVSADGDQLYFASNRPRDKALSDLRDDMLISEQAADQYDLYSAARIVGASNPDEVQFENAIAADALNSPFDEASPALTPRGDFIYFASNREGGQGGFDIYRARIVPGQPLVPQRLDDSINTAANELDPSLDRAGFMLLFSSDRPRMSGAGDEIHIDSDLYQSLSREVYREVDRAAVDWRAVLAILLPLLLWLLAGLLAFVILTRLFRSTRYNRLSLLARCLLVSALVHCLILLGMTVWTVSSAFSELMRGPGATRVALRSPTILESIETQVRGRLTDLAIETPDVQPSQARSTDIAAHAVASPQPMETITPQKQTQLTEQALQIERLVTDAATVAMQPTPLLTAEPDQPQLTEPSLAAIATPAAPTPADAAERAFDPSAPAASAAQGQAQPTETSTVASSTQATSLEALPRAAEADPSQTLAQGAIPQETDPSQVREAQAEARDRNAPVAAPQDLAVALPSAQQAEAVSETSSVVNAEDAARAQSQPLREDAALPGVAVADPATHELQPSSVERVADLDAPLVNQTPAAEDADAERIVDVASAAPRSVDVLPEAIPDSTTLSTPAAASPSTAEENDSPVRIAAQQSAESAPADAAERALPLTAEDAPGLVALDAPDAQRSDTPPSPLDDAVKPTQLREAAVADASPQSTTTDMDVIEPLEIASAATTDMESPEPQGDNASDTITPQAPLEIASARQRIAEPSLAPERMNVEDAAAESTFVPVEIRESDALPNNNAPSSLSPDRDMDTRARELAMPSELTRDRSPRIASEMAVAIANLPAIDTNIDTTATTLEVETRPNPFAQRSPERRAELLEAMGGSRETERAVALALEWLARHQSEDGHWDADEFDAHCRACGGTSPAKIDVALTSLALLAFLGSDHNHLDPGLYREVVASAITWLLRQQRVQEFVGCFGDETLYSHGIATIAITEAYAMTNDPRLAEPARKAVEFILASPSRRTGGWRYAPEQDGDTSVTGWQVMAIASARRAGIAVPPGELQHVQQWMESVRHPDEPGRYAYQPGRQYTDAMTAEGMFIQQLLGIDRTHEDMHASSAYLLDHLPDWRNDANTYYWYYGTLAMFHHGGSGWERWNKALKEQLIANQRTDGKARGSWDPADAWATTGGRVYQTAICALSLEVYYRYLPIYASTEVIDPAGTIRGHVYDAETREPLAGALVLLDVPAREAISVHTDDTGGYSILAPRMPDHFALSASKPGYAPTSMTASAEELHGKVVERDFMLQPATVSAISIEAEPTVHHLGNDLHEGRINSQFQTRSEGRRWKETFEVTDEQARMGYNVAEITFLCKGVQARNKVRINGRLLPDRLSESPSDGSFGEWTRTFDIRLLQVGTNEVMIESTDDLGDLDDFEFINVQIVLKRE
ncbi:MAG: hypothetical protein ACR2GY_00380 [Phycisphaerales bacterium]